MDAKKLIEEALKARESAYTPYSRFQVGAALLCADGSVYRGANIENAAYTPTVCAERVAFFKAVSDGVREFEAIAVCGGPQDGALQYCAPCGVCRQVMREFAKPDHFRILIARTPEDYKEFLLKDLLPESFGPDNLEL